MNLYTARERRGFIVVLIAVTFLLIFNVMAPLLFKPPNFDYTDFDREMKRYKDSMKLSTVSDDVTRELEPFDVNEVTASKLEGYGLPGSVAKTWIKYRDAIGGFTYFDQVKKIYGLDSNWLALNEDKMRLVVPQDRSSKFAPSVGGLKSKSKFNPNTANHETLKEAGLNENGIAALVEFRERGGTIFRKEEMKYISGVTDSAYAHLLETVDFDSSAHQQVLFASTDNPRKKMTEKMSSLDINQSNEYQWQMLKGVGPYYARNIIRYRGKLGGFSSVVQVAETYNLPDSVFNAIEPFLTMSPIFSKIPINAISRDSLQQHPYIDFKQASVIINYRNNHGPYQQISDLYKLRVFDSVFVRKIEPYISF